MISDQQEARLSDARTRSRQDRTNPLLINIDDGRLMPNVPRLLRHHSGKYVIYDGDPKADLAQRMVWLQSMGRRAGNGRRIVNTAVEAEVIDLGKMTKNELIQFAMEEFQVELNIAWDIKTMRAEVLKLHKAKEDLIAKSAAKAATGESLS